MDKSIKLPIFLGSVCLIASAALAGVNAITAPIISAREEAARMSGYLSVLGLESGEGYTMSDVLTSEGDLASKGITDYVYFLDNDDDSLFGAVYNATVSGWEPNIKFQVGISDGKFSGYNSISHNETASIGGVFISNLSDMIEGVACDDADALNDAINAYISGNIAGATANYSGVTRNGITRALIEAGAHYLTLEASL
jgi:Na+-translocating ferredoxin:NAD+ oxidoreductase RnfG subunit